MLPFLGQLSLANVSEKNDDEASGSRSGSRPGRKRPAEEQNGDELGPTRPAAVGPRVASEAADIATASVRRIAALPLEVLSPAGWQGLRVELPPFQRLLRVRIEAPRLVFEAKRRQIQRVLSKFAAAWRVAHPLLITFRTRPGVSVKKVSGDFGIVLVVEDHTSGEEEGALRAEFEQQNLANVPYYVLVERYIPVA